MKGRRSIVMRPARTEGDSHIALCLILAILSVLPTSALRAQSITATVIGTVTDTSGAAIPGAKIVATEVATNFTRSAVTDQKGNYDIPLLPIGTYQISAERDGFRKSVKQGITLTLGQKSGVNFTLAVGSVSQTVTVKARAPMTNAYTMGLSVLKGNVEVSNLPLRGRNYLDLLETVPGVVDRSYGASNGEFPPYTFGGVRPFANRFLLDGTNNTDMNYTDPVVNPPLDAIQEVQVETNMYSAEYQGGGGGVINAVTKSGTNQFHGTLYDYLRNGSLDARDFFSLAPVTPFEYNQFGGAVGGPVLVPKIFNGRNHTFFFIDYEGIRERTPVSNFELVPTPAEKSGDFSSLNYQLYNPESLDASGLRVPFPGNQLSPSEVSPLASKVLAFFPAANIPLNSFNQNWYNQTVNTNNSDQYTIKIDQRFGDQWSLFGRYTYYNQNALTPIIYTGLGGSKTGNTGQNLGFGVTTVISPHALNEFRFGWEQLDEREAAPASQSVNWDAELGFPEAPLLVKEPQQYAFPAISIVNFGGLGAPDSSLVLDEDGPNHSWDARDTLTVVRGAHTLKTGFDWTRFYRQTFLLYNRQWTFNGFYTALVQNGNFATAGNSFADFLLGDAATGTFQNVLPGIPFAPNRTFDTIMGGFVQDDWKVSRHLTVNLGLRYDAQLPPIEPDCETTIGSFATDPPYGIVKYPSCLKLSDNLLTPQFSMPTPAQGGAVIAPGKYFTRVNTNQLWNFDWNDFQPRIGIAYLPLGNAKTVIRASGGLFNYQTIGNGAFGAGLNPPFLSFTEPNLDQTVAPTLFLGSSPPQNVTTSGIFVYNFLAQDHHDPLVYNWTFQIQHQVGQNTLLDVTYLGNRAFNLDKVLFFNVNKVPGAQTGTGCPAPCPVARPFPATYPQFGLDRTIGPWGWSYYSGLEVDAKRRFSSGFLFDTDFTWSKGFDNGVHVEGDVVNGGQGDGQPNNLYQPQNWKQVSQDSPGLRFSSDFVYALPFGSGKHFQSSRRLVNALAGGWSLSGVFAAQNGFPFSVYNGTVDISGDGITRELANRLCNGNLPSGQRTLTRWFNTSCFALPELNTWGTAGSRILKGPGLILLDGSFFRKFSITEDKQLQFRVDMFNLPNHPNFGPFPDNVVTDAQFGKITSTSTPARDIQLSLTFNF